MTQEKRENFMFTKDTIFYKKLWSLMLPMMLQNLMLALVAVADAFMLGGMDQNYMSAVSLATQIQFIQNMLLSAATGGLAILGAQYWGRGNIKTLDDIFCMALRLCGLVSIAFFIACICFPQYLMLFFTDEPVLIGYGVQYLRIAGFSYLLTGISQCYLVVMKISEHALTTALISSATVGINIALNAILIYGKLGITPMGVRGAATATLSARMIELACCILISSRPGYIRPSGLHPSVSDPSVSKKPGTGTGFPEMRNADSRCVPVLGSRIYFVFFFYGTSGSRRGRCQFCGGGCP